VIEISSPTFSAIITSYNHASYIEHCIQSVQAQSFSDVEIIVVDDGSTDSTLERLAPMARHDGRLHVFQHADGRNLGREATLRRAIEESNGTYLAFLASDDAWCTTRLEQQLPALRSGAALVYGKAQSIDEKGRAFDSPLGSSLGELSRQLESLLLQNVIPSLTVAVPRRLFDEVEAFTAQVDFEDFEGWLRIISRGRAVYIPEVLGEYRVLDQGAFRTISLSSREIWATSQAIEAFARWDGLPNKQNEAVQSWNRCWRALSLLTDGDSSVALSGLEKTDTARFRKLVRNRLRRLVVLNGRDLSQRWKAAWPNCPPEIRRSLSDIRPTLYVASAVGTTVLRVRQLRSR
jgi:glycosyltransferase involved in cell wall biosynthesis